MEAASRTAPKPERIQLDAVDGCWLLIRRIRVEAALTSYEVAGKERKYNERPSASTTTATAKFIGLRLLLLAAVIMVAAKTLPTQTKTRQMTKRLV